VHNTGLLCWFHHELVHRLGAENLRVTTDGRWRIERPQRSELAA
jgi:hypothetical protein